MTSITTELMVDDMKKSLDFYINVLGFDVALKTPDENPIFAIIKNQNVELMLYVREEFANEIPTFKNKQLGGSIALYIGVEEIEKLYGRLKNKVKIIQDLHTTNYNSKEFSFEDINGYVLMMHEG